MNEKNFISIIVPYYNTPEELFRRCMDSVIYQTYGNYEIIVIDDGSSDAHKAILDKIAAVNSKIRIVHKKHEGVSTARNVGVHYAQYDYIMFLDSDDAITGYCLEEAAEVILEEQPDLLFGLVRKFNEAEMDSLQVTRRNPLIRVQLESDTDKARLLSHVIGYMDKEFTFPNGYIADGPVARIFKKSIAVEISFLKEAVWDEDTIWNMQMIKKAKNICFINDLWYKYYMNPTSSVHKFRPNCPYEFNYIIKTELNIAKELWPYSLQAVYHKIFNNIVILCRTFLFHSGNPLTFGNCYQIYKECIHSETYREVLKGISFKNEKRIPHRIIKEILRVCSYYGPHIVSYGIWRLFFFLMKE